MVRLLIAAILFPLLQDPARVDLAGDPLPEGALSRLGTRRWRTPGRVWSLAFAKDGRTLLVGAGTTLLTWDLEKNQRIRAFQGHRGVVGSIALLPDGVRVLTGAGDGTMGLWNLENGARIRSFTGHEGRVWSVAVSKDGATALSAGMDGTIGLWNVETGERLRTIKAHKGSAMSAVFLKDETRILSGGADGRLILWDAATGDRLKSVVAHTDEISGIVVGPDGRTAVTTSGRLIPGDAAEPLEGAMAVWDLEEYRRLRLIPARSGFLWAAFMADGKSVVAGSADRTASLWDIETGTRLQAFEGLGDRTHPIAVRDGLVAVGDGTSVALFDANTGKRRFDVPGHSDGVGGVGFLPDGRAVTAGADGWLAIWDPATGKRLRTIDTGGLEFACLALSADGRFALTGGWRAPISMWNVETGEAVRRFEGYSARALAFGSGTVTTGHLDGRVLVWDSETGVQIRQFAGSSSGALAVRPDGKRGLVCTPPKAVAVVDFDSGQVARRIESQGREFTCVAYSPDGTMAAVGGLDGAILLWDGDCEKQTGRIDAGSAVRCLAFGPKGLLIAGHSGGVSVWDAPAGKRLAEFKGHNSITSVAIDREGRHALSGSGDTTAIVWKLPAR